MAKERKTKKISKEEALKIILDPTAAETGLFWCFSGVAFVGIDNTTHEAWTEDFRTRRELFDWLLSRGKRSEKRMVYAEDVIQRIRDLAPEILGGEYNPDMENEVEQLVCVVENTQTAAAQDAQRWRYTAEEPPKEEDGDCCGRVLIAHAGAHCAVATSLQYAKKNSEAVRVWMPLPKLPWEAEK